MYLCKHAHQLLEYTQRMFIRRIIIIHIDIGNRSDRWMKINIYINGTYASTS